MARSKELDNEIKELEKKLAELKNEARVEPIIDNKKVRDICDDCDAYAQDVALKVSWLAKATLRGCFVQRKSKKRSMKRTNELAEWEVEHARLCADEILEVFRKHLEWGNMYVK